tara:strand:+ start:22 stop:483 length:462 start_codon:yes stop_codon:yes gene_type:complete
MAMKNGGYLGRVPGNANIVIAKQVHQPTGLQTDFTFASGYTPGYMDVYINGSRLIHPDDYSAEDGSTVGLTTAAINGDVLELVAYKAYDVGNVTNATLDFAVGSQLTVSGISTCKSDVYVGINTDRGVVLTSPNGTAYRLIVSNAGALSAVAV